MPRTCRLMRDDEFRSGACAKLPARSDNCTGPPTCRCRNAPSPVCCLCRPAGGCPVGAGRQPRPAAAEDPLEASIAGEFALQSGSCRRPRGVICKPPAAPMIQCWPNAPPASPCSPTTMPWPGKATNCGARWHHSRACRGRRLPPPWPCVPATSVPQGANCGSCWPMARTAGNTCWAR